MSLKFHSNEEQMDYLQLESLLWTIPGICFLFSYQRLRDVETIEYSGWPYVFFIVLIGCVTVLPIKWFFDSAELTFFILLASSIIAFLIPFFVKFFIYSFLVEKIEEDPNFYMPSTFWSIVYFFYPIENKDKFIKQCIDYEGEAVLVTVDESVYSDSGVRQIESKVYFGILIEFPYVATKIIDSHAIKILPLLSGYNFLSKNEEKGENKEKIKWTIRYKAEGYENSANSSGLLIPRGKIINFRGYDEELHEELVFGSSQ